MDGAMQTGDNSGRVMTMCWIILKLRSFDEFIDLLAEDRAAISKR
jgi:hypothetical protein